MKYSDTLKHLFATHPTVDKFHFTTDGQAFIRKDHADAHGKTLEDKTVTPASRGLFEQVEAMKDKLAANTENAATGVTPPAPAKSVVKPAAKPAAKKTTFKAAPAPVAPVVEAPAPVAPVVEIPAPASETDSQPQS